MPTQHDPDENRLRSERNIWIATVRADGRPHLVPVWFVWHEGRAYVCTQEGSIKIKNLRRSALISFALEDGDKAVTAEGTAEFVDAPFPAAVLDIFKNKYGWNIATDTDPNVMFAITPVKWLQWRPL